MKKGYDYSAFRDRLRNEFEKSQSTGDNFILKDRASVRVLPYTNDSGEVRLYKEAPVHFGVTKGPVYCATASGNYCPVCDAVKAANASGDLDDVKWAKSCELRRRYLFNIVNMDLPAEQRKVQVMQAPFSLKQAILSIYTDPEYEKAIFVEGRDLILTKTGTGLDTEYNAKIRMQATTYDRSLDKEVFDLDRYVILEDVASLKSLLGPRAVTAATDDRPPRRSGGWTGGNADEPREQRGARRASAPPIEEDPFGDEEELDPVTGAPFEDDTPPPPPPRGRTPGRSRR